MSSRAASRWPRCRAVSSIMWSTMKRRSVTCSSPRPWRLRGGVDSGVERPGSSDLAPVESEHRLGLLGADRLREPPYERIDQRRQRFRLAQHVTIPTLPTVTSIGPDSTASHRPDAAMRPSPTPGAAGSPRAPYRAIGVGKIDGGLRVGQRPRCWRVLRQAATAPPTPAEAGSPARRELRRTSTERRPGECPQVASGSRVAQRPRTPAPSPVRAEPPLDSGGAEL